MPKVQSCHNDLLESKLAFPINSQFTSNKWYRERNKSAPERNLQKYRLGVQQVLLMENGNCFRWKDTIWQSDVIYGPQSHFGYKGRKTHLEDHWGNLHKCWVLSNINFSRCAINLLLKEKHSYFSERDTKIFMVRMSLYLQRTSSRNKILKLCHTDYWLFCLC